jgi:hypothetical protein
MGYDNHAQGDGKSNCVQNSFVYFKESLYHLLERRSYSWFCKPTEYERTYGYAKLGAAKSCEHILLEALGRNSGLSPRSCFRFDCRLHGSEQSELQCNESPVEND